VEYISEYTKIFRLMSYARIAVLAVLLLSVGTQTVDMSITLTDSDVTTFQMSSLFPKVGAGYTYNVSHPAAIIQTFNEVGVTTNNLMMVDKYPIEAWRFQSAKRIFYYLAGNSLCLAQYNANTFSFENNTCAEAKKPDDKYRCTGLKVTNSWVAVGCLSTDPQAVNKTFDVMPYINGQFAQGSTTTVNITEGSPISGYLRIEAPPTGTVILVYDEQAVTTQTDTSSLYVLKYDGDKNMFVLNNLLKSIDTSAIKMIFDITWTVAQEGDIHGTISMFDNKTSNLELNDCLFTNIGCAVETDFCFQTCTELGVSKLAIKSGRGRLLTDKDADNYVAFDKTDPNNSKIIHCLYNTTSKKYDDCLTTIRQLPFGASAQNVIVTAITGYNLNLAVHFLDTTTMAKFVIYDLTRYQATGTMAVSFESPIFPDQIDTLTLQQDLAICVQPKVFHVFQPVDPSQYSLQINAVDLPAPSANSNVKLRRALIYVSQTDASKKTITKKISVTVLDKMNSVMGFTDQLPEFGGIPEGAQFTNMDRTWIYGNNLQFSAASGAIDFDKSEILDKDQIQYNFEPDVEITSIHPVSIGELILQSQDADNKTFVHWFACMTDPDEPVVKNCISKFNFELPAGYSLYRSFPTTSFPDTNQATAIVLILKNDIGNIMIHYLWRADTSKNVPLTLREGTTYRDVYVINFKDTLMFFTAPMSTNGTQIDVYTAPNNPTDLVDKELTYFRAITPADVKLSAFGFAPFHITSCGHSDYVIEYLSGNGYLVKLNVFGASKPADIALRLAVRVVHPRVPFTVAGFCPFGDEFLVWDQGYKNIFSVSTLNDNSFYDFKISEFGLLSVTSITCASRSAAAGIWGPIPSNNKAVLTVYGNQFNAAHSKIHSIIPSSVGFINYTATPSLGAGTIGQFFLEEGALTSWVFSLGGPYLVAKYKATIPDPNLVLTLTSGGETRTITKQINFQKVNYDVRLQRTANVTIEKGQINLENSTNIIGHLPLVTLTVPENMTQKVTLQQRSQLVKSVSAADGIITFIHVLDSRDGCVLYLGKDQTTKTITFSVRGTNCNKDHDTGRTMFSFVDGRIEANQAVIAGVYKVGGYYMTAVYYVKFQGDNVAILDDVNRGRISAVRIVRVPGGDSVTHALFHGFNQDNMWTVLKVVRDAGTFTTWDSIPNCYNVWPAAINEGAVVFFNTYRSTGVSTYVLGSPNVAKGTVQAITFDGSNSEFSAVKCATPAAYQLHCAMVTFGPHVVVLSATFNSTTWMIPDGGFSTRSLFNFANQGESGSYTSVDVIPGWVLLQGEEGSLDLYSTAAQAQGYLYTRIPAATGYTKKSLKSKLGGSLVHDQAPNSFALLPNTVNQTRPSLVRIASYKANSNDAAQLETYSIQPLTIDWEDDSNDLTALKLVQLSLGGGATPTKFDMSEFIDPVPPKPEPQPEEEKGFKWYWIMLIILIILGIIGGVAFYMKNKQRGAEDDGNYSKNEPFVDEKPAQKKKDSDEFN